MIQKKCTDCNCIISKKAMRCKSCSNVNGCKNGYIHPLWKGKEVSYRTLHQWLCRNKKKPERCQSCNKKNKNLDCANISGNYERDINDYEWLCRSCHMNRDGRIKNLKNQNGN